MHVSSLTVLQVAFLWLATRTPMLAESPVPQAAASPVASGLPDVAPPALTPIFIGQHLTTGSFHQALDVCVPCTT